jgi:hypothetical protein
MRKIVTLGCVVLSFVCGCDVGEYLSVMELLGNDAIITAGIKILEGLITGAIA